MSIMKDHNKEILDKWKQEGGFTEISSEEVFEIEERFSEELTKLRREYLGQIKPDPRPLAQRIVEAQEKAHDKPRHIGPAIDRMIEEAKNSKPLTEEDVRNINKDVEDFRKYLDEATKVSPEILKEPFTI